ncbi:MAG TPA: serine/threonine-protein kinase [Polyangia bacterium]|nr:serine/threonine-protein kinase [Polyangia bacterium]
MNERGLTRTAAVGLIVAGGAVIAAGFWVKSTGTGDPQALESEAQAARQRIEQSVEAQARILEPRAAQAASVAQLVAGLESGIDGTTFQDLFDSEDWWASIRKSSPYTALVSGDDVLASTGMEKLEVTNTPIVARARASRLASGLTVGTGRAYLLAAALVTRGKHREDRKPVVVLGELLDEAHLQRIAERTGDAVGMTDGKKLLDTAGPAERRHLLQSLVGREKQGLAALENGFVGTAVPLGQGLWMWAVSPSTAPPPSSSSKPMLLWGLGAAVVGIGLGVMGRRRPGSRARATERSGSRARRTLYVGSTRELQIEAESVASAPPAPSALDVRRMQTTVGPTPAPVIPRPAPQPPPHQPTALAATAVATATAPNDVLGRYTLLERIGEGGMAEIYIAASHGAEGFERRFVVKRLHQHLARRKEAVTQFIDEARLQAQLVHSNIVPVFDFGRAGEEYFLALEYIHGRDLEKLLQRHIQVYNQPLDLRVVAYVVHEVLEALAYAHTKRDQSGKPLEIVHRDVSPANILISYQGEVKLSDFGIVKAGNRVSQTEMGMVKGNASFMSPEQARGIKVDARSDLFSTAVVMFCCLTGQALYKGETTLNQLVRAAVGPATQQFQAIETLPPQSVHILSKALMLDPNLRYQTAGDFARELAPLIPGMKAEVARLMAELFPEGRRPTS